MLYRITELGCHNKLEKKEEEKIILHLHYVSLLTVGYGDISCLTEVGRVFSLMFLAVGLVSTKEEIGLLDLMALCRYCMFACLVLFFIQSLCRGSLFIYIFTVKFCIYVFCLLVCLLSTPVTALYLLVCMFTLNM